MPSIPLLLLIAGSLVLSSCVQSGGTKADPSSRFRGPGYGGESWSSATPSASPLSMEELGLLRSTLFLDEEQVALLRKSRAILEPQVEAILDVWYGFVGANPHLLASFSNSAGVPDTAYLGAVRKRFGQWILDTADADFDRDWLDYQYEIGLRHHSTRKNVTDGADAAPIVKFRYLAALFTPITVTLRPFLESTDASKAEVDAMQEAWRRAVLLQVILWSQPYMSASEF